MYIFAIIYNSHALKSFRKGPSLRSLAASVKARNLLNPVVAAPRPSAAALVSTSSRDAINPTEARFEIAGTVAAGGAGDIAWPSGATLEGCEIAGAPLLKSSNILCWSDFLRPWT